jgi:hypothetical protein
MEIAVPSWYLQLAGEGKSLPIYRPSYHVPTAPIVGHKFLIIDLLDMHPPKRGDPRFPVADTYSVLSPVRVHYIHIKFLDLSA